MAQDDFNKELGDYLDSRKGGPKRSRLFDIFRRSSVSREERLMEPQPIQEAEEIEDAIEEVDELEEELAEERESLVKRLLRKLRLIRDYDYEEEAYEEVPEMDEEVKEVLKIAFAWINKLPAAEKRAFKQSPDFEKFKTVLGKYGLIKEA